MEAVLGRSSGHGGLVIKKEEIIIKRSDAESSGRDDVDCKQDFALKIGNTGRPYDEISEDNKRSSPKQKNLISNKQVPETADKERSSIEPDHSMVSSLRRMKQDNDQLESTKAEMGEVREENERLKMYLGKIMKDYQTLQMQFNNIVQQEAAAKNNIHREIEDSELVSLSLGSFSGANEKIKGEKGKIPSTKNAKEINSIHREKQDGHDQEGLSLALDYKYVSEASNKSGATDQGGPAGSNPSAESSFEEPKEEAGETWPPSKILKPAKRSSEQDEVSQVENPAVKKTRVCVRARCDTPTMNDGCQWRKYGQKIAKGNPCPRAYYRCTVAPSCPVRKQVQRCADDMSILITTYEGTHNHQLPVSATAMASTTSAAASMLLSGSSTSSSSAVRPSPPSATAPGFSTFDSLKWNNKVAQLCLPNATTYSSFSSSHPTITLDLTSTPSNSSPFLSKFSNSSPSSSTPNYHHTLYPSTSLSFGSSDNSINNTNNVSWSTSNSFLSYSSSAQQQAYNLKNQIMGTLGLGRQTTPLLQNPSNNNNNVTGYVQNYMQQKISTNPSSGTSISTQVPDSSTIAAATKAITADPTFQSALAAALTSIIGGSCGGGGQVSNILQGDVVQNMKWSPGSGDHHQHQGQFPASTSATELSQTSTKGNVTGCASTFLNKTVAANSQPAGSLMFLSPNSLSFSASKSASASPGDTREQTST